MKALTIMQPYAHLICLPESDPNHKRVENREWQTKYRGPLVIHAGKGKGWLDGESRWKIGHIEIKGPYPSNYGIRVADMVFGAAVAIATLTDCIHIEEIEAGGRWDTKYPWLRRHLHTNGTWCFVLQDVRPLPKPIPYRGAQGFWNFPDEMLVESGITPVGDLHENGDGC